MRWAYIQVTVSWLKMPILTVNDTAMTISLKKGMEEKIIGWLRHIPKPTGLFCPSDSQAIFVINLCQLAGIAIPHEIAVLGVENNLVLCNATSPSLSSIAVNGRETGFLAAKLLDLRISGKRIPRLPIRIAPGEIVTRQSTDIMAVDDPDVFQALRLLKENPGGFRSTAMKAPGRACRIERLYGVFTNCWGIHRKKN